MNLINGIQCIGSLVMVDSKTFQRRIHKTKRINKKWRKLYGNRVVSIPKKDVYVFDGKIICHPATLKAMIDKINSIGKDEK